MAHCGLASALWTLPSGTTSHNVLHFFLCTNTTPVCGYNTLSLSVHQLMDISVVSAFWLLWIRLL